MIYEIPCADCNDRYIGKSGRSMDVQLVEHTRNVRKGEVKRSAGAEHAVLTDHKIDWEKARIVDKSSKYWKRRVKEAVCISKCEGRVNKDGGLRLSKLWLNLF